MLGRTLAYAHFLKRTLTPRELLMQNGWPSTVNLQHMTVVPPNFPEELLGEESTKAGAARAKAQACERPDMKRRR